MADENDNSDGLKSLMINLGEGAKPDDATLGQLHLMPNLRDNSSNMGSFEREDRQISNPEKSLPKKRGRPKGARNKRSEKVVKYIKNKYGSPLEALAQTYSLSPKEIADELDCDLLEAAHVRKNAAIAALPYLEQKRPIEVESKGGNVAFINISGIDFNNESGGNDDVITIDMQPVEKPHTHNKKDNKNNELEVEPDKTLPQ